MVPSAAAQAGQALIVHQMSFQGNGGSETMALTPAVSAGSAFSTSNLILMHSNGSASPLDGQASGPYTPAQMRQAYGFNQIAFNNGTIQGDGSGQTIAIVDAYDDPNIGYDLPNFDVEFGLPDPSLTIAKQYVNGQPPPVDSSGGWEMEESLDVEWAHAMAPGANILLVETYDPNYVLSGVQWAASQPGVSVVSMSFGDTADSFPPSENNLFTTPAGHAGVTFVAAAGDHGLFGFPAYSPNVVAVGGTTLSLDASGNYLGETVWNNGDGWSGGGGQNPNGGKSAPDVAYNAGAPVWIYDSFDNSPHPWQGVGGTSAGAPQWAALIAIADQGRALEGKGSLDGPSQTLPMLHSMPSSAFHTNIPGSNQNGISGQGVIGLGTPYANLVVAGLAQEPMPSPPPAPSPPPVSSPPPVQPPPVQPPPVQPPPSPWQLYYDGKLLAFDLSRPGGLSAALADTALMHDIAVAPGGLFNQYLDDGFFAVWNNGKG